MRPQVFVPFYNETEELEGNIEHMYCDSLGFVTVGIGHKIESNGKLTDTGRTLPFRFYSTKQWALESEILQEFDRVKKKGGDYRAAKTVALLFLSGSDRTDDFDFILDEMEEALKIWLPKWVDLPGEAQQAVLSMAWNLGTNFLNPKATAAYWPNLHSQLKSSDFYGAAGNCLINGRPSARNSYNRVHFLNAQRQVNLKLNVSAMPGNKLLISANKVVAAAKSPSKVSEDGWNVQACLKTLNLYTSSLDGLYGSVSQAAWKKYCKNKGFKDTYTVSSLNRLAVDATVTATVSA